MTKKQNVQSARPSKDSKAAQALRISHPQQDLTGVRLRTKPVPESGFDHVIKRDARIFEHLARAGAAPSLRTLRVSASASGICR